MGRKERKAKRAKRKQERQGMKRVMNVLGGSFLVKENFLKQFPFMVTVTLLLMVLITNTYVAEERNREIAKNTRLLNDLHVNYIQLKSDIMEASKQSVLSKRLSGLGIRETTDPVKRISIAEEAENTEEAQ